MINKSHWTFKPQNNSCKNKGSLITEKAAVMDQWVDYFEEMMSRDQQENQDPALNLRDMCSIDSIEPPEEEEIRDAKERLKSNKALGIDNIPQELFKNCGYETIVSAGTFNRHMGRRETTE